MLKCCHLGGKSFSIKSHCEASPPRQAIHSVSENEVWFTRKLFFLLKEQESLRLSCLYRLLTSQTQIATPHGRRMGHFLTNMFHNINNNHTSLAAFTWVCMCIWDPFSARFRKLRVPFPIPTRTAQVKRDSLVLSLDQTDSFAPYVHSTVAVRRCYNSGKLSRANKRCSNQWNVKASSFHLDGEASEHVPVRIDFTSPRPKAYSGNDWTNLDVY